ncbi:MAG TPA: cobalamin-binding protein [bacterium]|nr:cobalamin-binding protein [bacterium]
MKTKFFFILLLNSFFLPAAWGLEPTPAIPQRVISMAPNLTEMIYDIGASDQLVGVTDYCKFPPVARLKPKVGGWINPNYEKIVSLKPDLVLALQFHGPTVDHLKELKLPYLVIDCQTVEDILKAYDTLGKALGHESDAQRGRSSLERRLTKARSKASQHKPVSVLFVISHSPGALDQLYGVGPGNFVDELLSLSGGANILSDAKEPYPLISKEQLIKRDPDVIIDSLPSSENSLSQVKATKESWKKFKELRAIRDNHLFILTRDDYLIPGPTMAGLAEYLSGVFAKVKNN